MFNLINIYRFVSGSGLIVLHSLLLLDSSGFFVLFPLGLSGFEPRGIYALLPLGHDVWVCGHHPAIQVFSQRDMAPTGAEDSAEVVERIRAAFGSFRAGGRVFFFGDRSLCSKRTRPNLSFWCFEFSMFSFWPQKVFTCEFWARN